MLGPKCKHVCILINKMNFVRQTSHSKCENQSCRCHCFMYNWHFNVSYPFLMRCFGWLSAYQQACIKPNHLICQKCILKVPYFYQNQLSNIFLQLPQDGDDDVVQIWLLLVRKRPRWNQPNAKGFEKLSSPS